MRRKGRPSEAAIKLKNGFYFEVCTKGMKKGMKIRSEDQKSMEQAADGYARYKDVIILGEYKDGIPFIEPPVS